MSDYHFHTGVLRDEIVSELVDKMEQTPYVLAKIADLVSPPSMNFDEFCDYATELGQDDRQALARFGQALADRFSD
ncbi:hypothetical protein [Pseudooceanicola algae]|uniref:Uncharacterized protein n=1 Tax=Pseudooceanicola algae TaxID=1537215 RepID=A0A418SKC6_9RHOB|nr:hypothetical protein [Pseudooceanicola algae]QPM89133.1 hypothetical protein PSAL_003440 [Pseudooceanicola algae]